MTGQTHGEKAHGTALNQVSESYIDPLPSLEYTNTEALVMAIIMQSVEERFNLSTIEHGTQHLLTYSLKKGIEKFKDRGTKAALKDMKQLHDRECFKPIHRHTLSSVEHVEH